MTPNKPSLPPQRQPVLENEPLPASPEFLAKLREWRRVSLGISRGEIKTLVPFPACLISGGQTGADRAALDFALAHGITHAGFCPKGRKSEDGPIPSRYNLTETESADYPERTRKNVEMADATAIFARVPADDLLRQRRSGSGLTARQAQRAGRPFVVLSHFPDVQADADELCAFLERHSPRILNVAGSRESTQPGVAAHVAAVLEAVATRMPAAAPQSNLYAADVGHAVLIGMPGSGKATGHFQP